MQLPVSVSLLVSVHLCVSLRTLVRVGYALVYARVYVAVPDFTPGPYHSKARSDIPP